MLKSLARIPLSVHATKRSSCDLVRSWSVRMAPLQARRSYFVTSYEWRVRKVERSTHDSRDRQMLAELSQRFDHDHDHVDELMDIGVNEKVFRDTDVATVLARKVQEGKGQVIFVDENDTVFHAIGIMDKACVGACLVNSNQGDVVGVLTERDYLRKIALKGLSSKTTKVKDVMTVNFPFVKEEDTVHQCLEKMATHHIRHLPVKNAEGKVVGVVSRGDCLKSILQEVHDTTSYLSAIISDK